MPLGEPKDYCEVLAVVGADRQQVLMELAIVEGPDDQQAQLSEWQQCSEVAARLDCVFLEAVKLGLWCRRTDRAAIAPRPGIPCEQLSYQHDWSREQAMEPGTSDDEIWPGALGPVSLGQALGISFLKEMPKSS